MKQAEKSDRQLVWTQYDYLASANRDRTFPSKISFYFVTSSTPHPLHDMPLSTPSNADYKFDCYLFASTYSPVVDDIAEWKQT